MFKGYRTIIAGLAMAAGAPALQYLAGVDWTHILPGPWGIVVPSIVMVGMRFITNGPVGAK